MDLRAHVHGQKNMDIFPLEMNEQVKNSKASAVPAKI